MFRQKESVVRSETSTSRVTHKTQGYSEYTYHYRHAHYEKTTYTQTSFKESPPLKHTSVEKNSVMIIRMDKSNVLPLEQLLPKDLVSTYVLRAVDTDYSLFWINPLGKIDEISLAFFPPFHTWLQEHEEWDKEIESLHTLLQEVHATHTKLLKEKESHEVPIQRLDPKRYSHVQKVIEQLRAKIEVEDKVSSKVTEKKETEGKPSSQGMFKRVLDPLEPRKVVCFPMYR